MEGSDWDDDDRYPAAPQPRHERGWRHPSEIGADAWHHSEPPLVIGRGLGAATGVVGVLLGLALVWSLLPSHTGRSAVVSVRSTIAPGGTSAIAAGGDSSTTSVRAATTSTSAPPTTARSTNTAVTTGPSDSPMPTYQVGLAARPDDTATTAVGSTIVAPPPPGAFAVAVDGGNLLLTTAQAVGNDDTVRVHDGGGRMREADVLVIDRNSGLAVLSSGGTPASGSFDVDSDVQPGDELTIYGDEPATFTVGEAGLEDGEWVTRTDLYEGSPVLDGDGDLVALCTHTADGIELVPVVEIDELHRALGKNVKPGVWMGVVLNDDPSGALTIGAVEPDGPAAMAGLDVGDTIVAIDGEPIADLAQLTGALALHQPGDVIELDVLSGDGTVLDVEVTLSAPPEN